MDRHELYERLLELYEPRRLTLDNVMESELHEWWFDVPKSTLAFLTKFDRRHPGLWGYPVRFSETLADDEIRLVWT